jgi:hypothetical protein
VTALKDDMELVFRSLFSCIEWTIVVLYEHGRAFRLHLAHTGRDSSHYSVSAYIYHEEYGCLPSPSWSCMSDTQTSFLCASFFSCIAGDKDLRRRVSATRPDSWVRGLASSRPRFEKETEADWKGKTRKRKRLYASTCEMGAFKILLAGRD